jgi:hypothetical protein
MNDDYLPKYLLRNGTGKIHYGKVISRKRWRHLNRQLLRAGINPAWWLANWDIRWFVSRCRIAEEKSKTKKGIDFSISQA